VPELKISLSLPSVGLGLKKSLPIASQWGVSAVELDGRGEIGPGRISQTGLRQLRKMIDDYRLRVSGIWLQTRGTYYDHEGLDRRIDATKKIMETANSLGARVVVLHIGRIPQDADSPARRLLVEVLTDLGRHGHRVGAMLAAETGSSSGDELGTLLDELPEATLGVDLNPGNLIRHGFSPTEAVDRLGNAILSVHATDATGDRADGRSGFTRLGEGDADYPALLGALHQHDYRGHVTLVAREGERIEADLDHAMAFLRRF